MKKHILLLMSLAVSLTITAFADHTIERRYVDRHCSTHIQTVRIDEEGNEDIESDIIIVQGNCDGDDGGG